MASGQQRQPPPSLFLGPPSRDSSRISLPATLAQNTAPTSTASAVQRQALTRQRSNRNVPSTRQDGSGAGEIDPAGPSLLSPDSPLTRTSTLPRKQPPQQQQTQSSPAPTRQREEEQQRRVDRTDALWVEMQSTLEEVELSAAHGAHAFGTDHSKALEELRTAQISLAQAWARSEADEAAETAADGDGNRISKGTSLLGPKEGETSNSSTTGGKTGSGSSKDKNAAASSTAAALGASKLEEETENDILQARKRREANDRYFQRVNGGVLDVVAKLEQVAVAMRGVERQSREIWSSGESGSGGSTTTGIDSSG